MTRVGNVLERPIECNSSSGTFAERRWGSWDLHGFGLVQAKDAFDLLDKFGCDAGGDVLYNPPSKGGVGGCNQPLTNLTKLSISEPSFVVPSTGDNCQKLIVTLLTDDYAYETSWELERVSDGVVLQTGPPGGGAFQDNTMYSGPASGCLDSGTYEFTIIGEGHLSPFSLFPYS